MSERRFQYEAEVRRNPMNYDAWFDYARLEESAGDPDKVCHCPSAPLIICISPRFIDGLYISATKACMQLDEHAISCCAVLHSPAYTGMRDQISAKCIDA